MTNVVRYDFRVKRIFDLILLSIFFVWSSCFFNVT